MQLEYELLHEESLIQHFDCGEEELNSFLKNLAFLF